MSLAVLSLACGAPLARAVAERLGTTPLPVEERGFEDGEHKIRPLERVRGSDLYLVQSLYGEPGLSADEKLLRTLFLAAALRDHGAARVTLVAPYLAYARKDRRTKLRDPVSIRYLAELVEAVGIRRVAALDVHNPAAFENAFRIETVHLEARGLFVRHLLATLADRPLKVITTLHGTDITLVGLDPSFYPITRFSIARSDGLTAVSQYLRQETVRRFALPAAAIEVIPNFVDLDRYRRDLAPCHRAQLAPGGEKIVMHISNFRPVKRVPDVVRIFAAIRRALPARLVLVGDGPDRGRAQEVARQEGVLDDVAFLGKQASVAELLACADLVLLPSESEAFGLVALEAMACGVPVVATAVGGVPEVVPHGEAGYLAPVGAIEEMAGAAIRLLSDEARWHAASAAARTAATRFGADRIVPRYEAYYRKVLEA